MRPLFPVPLFFWLLGAAAVGLTARPANAESESRDGDPTQESITPPVLTSTPNIEPPQGVELVEPVSVLLELEIDGDGRVTGARALDGRGSSLEAAAEERAKELVFQPARKGAAAVAVRIRYEYWFAASAAQTEPPPSKDAAPPAAEPRQPARSAPPASPPVAAPPAAPARGDDAEPPEDEGFGAVAEVEAPPREVTRYSIPREELKTVPGTGGDALRAIEVLPGVARTGIGQGDPILRGAAWNESKSFIEGDTVPLLFHFGGLKSAFNSELLERVDLYPGNFSSRFGRATGGVLEAKIRDPRRERPHGVIELGLLDSMALVETPVGKQLAVAVAARRSNVDFFFDQFIPEDKFSVVAAPVYWDYQAIATYQINPRHSVRFLGYGSHDSLRLLFAEPSSSDPSLRGNVGVTMEYHRVQAALSSRLGARVRQRTQATFGSSLGNMSFGAEVSRFDNYELFARSEWTVAAADRLDASFGFDFEGTFIKGRYEGAQAPQNEGNPDYRDASGGSFETKRVGGRIDVIRPGGYLELLWRPSHTLSVIPGLRADYDAFIDAWTVNPRLASRVQVLPETWLKGGVGLYSQSPEYYQSLSGFGNPALKPYHALHASGGVERYFGEELRLGCEGFFKHLTHRPVMTPGGAPPIYVNDGRGRIYGVELSARLRTGDTTGYFAYTLSRSERQDLDRPWRLFDLDQTHILIATASHDLGKRWTVGARFRLISGNPYTPVVGSVYDAGIDTYRPVHGPINSARNPLFHQLDLRIEKAWLVGLGRLAAYLDLQNAYNARHVEGTSYSFDYSRRQSAYGLPIFPNLGLRGEL